MPYRITELDPLVINEQFEKLPLKLYPHLPVHVVKSRSEVASGAEKLFLLIKDDEAAGRLIVYRNPQLWREKKILLAGNYECVDDAKAAKLLFGEASEFAKEKGAAALGGPLNGNTWNNYRLCLSPNSPEYFTEPFNLPYYPQQFSDNGFREYSTYFSALDTELEVDNEKLKALKLNLEAGGIAFRKFNVTEVETELKFIYGVSVKAFVNNFLYTEIPFADFFSKYKKMLSYIDPEFLIMAEKEGQPAAFIFAIPDHLEEKKKRLVIKTVAADPGLAQKGIGRYLVGSVTQMAREAGFQSIVHALMYDNGNSRNTSKKHGGKHWRQYALYKKDLRT